jgi:hypothetical protein
MKRFILAAGVAALAISAPAAAKPGGGHGDHAAKAQHGGGHGAKAQRGGGHTAKARGGGHATKAHGNSQRQAKRQAPRQHQTRVAKSHGQTKVRRAEAQRHDRADKRVKMVNRERHENRMRIADVRQDRARRQDIREIRNDRQRIADRRVADARNDMRFRDAGDRRWINRDIADNFRFDGCPPGLAKKHNGCMPPGQAKKLIGNRLPFAYRDSYLPVSLRDYYRDNDDYYYRYGDGYLYRVNRQDNLIAALLPMFGSALGLGTPFPAAYSNYGVPSYYQSFYPDTRDSYYRYANGNVYGIDPRTGLIEDVVPLMAGGYGVGQLLPAGYSAYNVPYQYRGYYPDSSDAYYRYAPGAIYQVDPRTNLVTSVASLLSPTGFAVGQPMPLGDSAYNVPYQYRSQYYDTPDSWYRYNTGYIYQVDPTTQLIQAVIQAIV